MEFEFCNVYRGTFGKTLPLLQRHPDDAVVILWNPNDYDQCLSLLPFLNLFPCLKQMRADHWSMIVFWSESTVTRPLNSPNVGTLIIPMSLFHFLLQVRHLHRMVLAMMMIYLDLQVIRILMFLMRSCHMTIWVMILQTWGEPEAVLLDRGPGPSGQPGGQDGDLPSGEIEFQYGPGGHPPPHYPGGGSAITGTR